MVHVFIPVKPATRFPGKNKLLFPYTAAWLAYELSFIKGPSRVYTVGYRSELPDVLPTVYTHLECDAGGHKKDLEYAEGLIGPSDNDLCFLTQVTQPLRRHGLLLDMVAAFKTSDVTSAVSYCTGRNDNWRTLDSNGGWSLRSSKRRVDLYDGALYGWRPGHVGEIFRRGSTHHMVHNYFGQPCDIDFAGDIPPALTSMWAELLHYNSNNRSI